jgi:glycosyltransferase involved in cell wall biosynthesis
MTRLLYLSADPGIPIFGHKGASVHTRELVGALAAEGAEVSIASPRIAPEGDSLDVDVEVVAIAPVVAKDHATAASLRAAIELQARQVVQIAERLEIEAIYERYSLHTSAGAVATEALGVPYLLEVNAPLRDEARRFRSLAHPDVAAETERRVFAVADHVFAISSPLADLLLRTGADRGKLDVMPNGVRAEQFPAHRGGGTGNFTVGFTGSLKPWHSVEVLVDAINTATTEIPDLRFEVIGEGPLAPVLDSVRIQPRRFRRHGARPHRETLPILATWDVGVAPYVEVDPTFYFCPLKVIDYMAAGICPVASDLGEIRSLLDYGECGVLVPPGDASALASTLVDLAGDRARAREVGARARMRAHASLSWRRNARRILDCVRSTDSSSVAHVCR